MTLGEIQGGIAIVIMGEEIEGDLRRVKDIAAVGEMIQEIDIDHPKDIVEKGHKRGEIADQGHLQERK